MTLLEQAKIDIRAAMDLLSQNKTYPGDIVCAKHHLTNALSGLIAAQQPSQVTECSICRREHGREIVHECE